VDVNGYFICLVIFLSQALTTLSLPPFTVAQAAEDPQRRSEEHEQVRRCFKVFSVWLQGSFSSKPSKGNLSLGKTCRGLPVSLLNLTYFKELVRFDLMMLTGQRRQQPEMRSQNCLLTPWTAGKDSLSKVIIYDRVRIPLCKENAYLLAVERCCVHKAQESRMTVNYSYIIETITNCTTSTDPWPTIRAGSALIQPSQDTLFMESVRARKNGH